MKDMVFYLPPSPSFLWMELNWRDGKSSECEEFAQPSGSNPVRIGDFIRSDQFIAEAIHARSMESLGGLCWRSRYVEWKCTLVPVPTWWRLLVIRPKV